MLVDLRPKGVTGKDAEAALGRAHITCNKNGIPFDPQPPTVTSGIRLGTPAGTTRGFGDGRVRRDRRADRRGARRPRRQRPRRQRRGRGVGQGAGPGALRPLPGLSRALTSSRPADAPITRVSRRPCKLLPHATDGKRHAMYPRSTPPHSLAFAAVTQAAAGDLAQLLSRHRHRPRRCRDADPERDRRSSASTAAPAATSSQQILPRRDAGAVDPARHARLIAASPHRADSSARPVAADSSPPPSTSAGDVDTASAAPPVLRPRRPAGRWRTSPDRPDQRAASVMRVSAVPRRTRSPRPAAAVKPACDNTRAGNTEQQFVSLLTRMPHAPHLRCRRDDADPPAPGRRGLR